MVVSSIVGGKWIIEECGSNDLSNFITITDQYGHSILQSYLTERDAKQYENVSVVEISGLFKTLSLDKSLSPEDKESGIPPIQIP